MFRNPEGIKDRREWNGKEYQLWEVILFSILAIAANAKTYSDIQRFIEVNFDKLIWLR
ncbi:MAG: transposase family protein [Holosporaceae bacterium]|nr:transposase family protein [Holosporaceae bacterium]